MNGKSLIHFETLGCKLNQAETEGAARFFSEAGFSNDFSPVQGATAVNEAVILAVLNTCTVTTKAEQKARRIIRLFLEKYPTATVVVTGCYAELDGPQIEAMNERIVVIPGTKKAFLSRLASLFKEKTAADQQPSSEGIRQLYKKYTLEQSLPAALSPAQITLLSNPKFTFAKDPFVLYTPHFAAHSRATLKIQEGCNNACTFCRIHLARGNSLSLDTATVIQRVKELEDFGYTEIVFTGVNLSQYRGLNSDGTFADFGQLLEKLLECTSRIYFRVSSYYPEKVTPALCAVLAHPRVRPSFHLSIQSGSDAVLKAMKRPYTAQTVYEAVSLLRSSMKNPFIACDIIGGFPGETEADFALTQKMCNDLQFSWIHAFPFSPRPGTPAYTMKPKVPEYIKDQRVKWLIEKAVSGKLEYMHSLEGTTVLATAENLRPEGDSFNAMTEQFLHVKCRLLPGQNAPKSGSSIQLVMENADELSIREGRDIDGTARLI